jgi:hypothetical protein
MCVWVGVLAICVLVFTVFCIVGTGVFVLFLFCIFIVIYCVCTSVRTSATELKSNSAIIIIIIINLIFNNKQTQQYGLRIYSHRYFEQRQFHAQHNKQTISCLLRGFVLGVSCIFHIQNIFNRSVVKLRPTAQISPRCFIRP